jgi:hypothetical protein
MRTPSAKRQKGARKVVLMCENSQCSSEAKASEVTYVLDLPQHVPRRASVADERRQPHPIEVTVLKPELARSAKQQYFRRPVVFNGSIAFRTEQQWIDALLRSRGMEPTNFSERVKWHLLARMIPLIHRAWAERHLQELQRDQPAQHSGVRWTDHGCESFLQHGSASGRAGRPVGRGGLR